MQVLPNLVRLDVMNCVKNDTMTGVSKDMYDVNKILNNLLDEDTIDVVEETTNHVHQFSYQITAGRVLNIVGILGILKYSLKGFPYYGNSRIHRISIKHTI